MSDQTLNHLHASLKALNKRIEKLGRKVNELDILAYRYKRLSYEINQIDVMAFEIRQEFGKVREISFGLTVLSGVTAHSVIIV